MALDGSIWMQWLCGAICLTLAKWQICIRWSDFGSPFFGGKELSIDYLQTRLKLWNNDCLDKYISESERSRLVACQWMQIRWWILNPSMHFIAGIAVQFSFKVRNETNCSKVQLYLLSYVFAMSFKYKGTHEWNECFCATPIFPLLQWRPFLLRIAQPFLTLSAADLRLSPVTSNPFEAGETEQFHPYTHRQTPARGGTAGSLLAFMPSIELNWWTRCCRCCSSASSSRPRRRIPAPNGVPSTSTALTAWIPTRRANRPSFATTIPRLTAPSSSTSSKCRPSTSVSSIAAKLCPATSQFSTKKTEVVICSIADLGMISTAFSIRIPHSSPRRWPSRGTCLTSWPRNTTRDTRGSLRL